MLNDVINRLVLNPSAMRFSARFLYPLFTRIVGGDDEVLFFNFGYEEDPPVGLPLADTDEADRYSIQLYYRTATQADLSGARVLEVSCGHGGGAAFLATALAPSSYVGMDLNKDGIQFCQRRHPNPNLEFLHGNAESLPFADNSFDAVISIEASHHYPSLPRFLAEVARVLRPHGHFLYSDLRPRRHITQWESDLAAAALRQVSMKEINSEILRGISYNGAQVVEHLERHIPRLPFVRTITRAVALRPFSEAQTKLANGGYSYRMYHFSNG